MKVVINNCYGGFNLSDKAIELCIERGMTCRKENEKKEADFIDFKKKTFSSRYYIDCRDKNEFRCNPIVISVVEELKEEANGFCSKLKIVDIPFDSTEGWEIKEYDGGEWIAEEHRTWA